MKEIETVVLSEIGMFFESVNAGKEFNVPILMQCDTGIGDIIINRFYPPKGKYFFNVRVYFDATKKLQEHTKLIDSHGHSKHLEELLVKNDIQSGYGVMNSERYIDVYTCGRIPIDRYYSEQIASLDDPLIEKDRNGLLEVCSPVESLLFSEDIKDVLLKSLSSNNFSAFTRLEYKYFIPELLSLSPIERDKEEVLLWLLVLRELKWPSSYKLLLSAVENLNPFSGGSLGLEVPYYSDYLDREVILLDMVKSVIESILDKFPVIKSGEHLGLNG